MRKNLNRIFTAFLLIWTVGLGVMMYYTTKNRETTSRDEKVAVNEIIQLARQAGENPKDEKALAAQEKLNRAEEQLLNGDDLKNGGDLINWIVFVYVTGLAVVLIIFLYINCVVIRPFGKLEKYAGEIAKGNFDVGLNYERKNFFGAFTWAFDHMRREIVRARACEKEAIDNNKTVISTLSHDIKTPIASIRTYAEALDASLDTNQEKRRRYSGIIIKKCDEVTKLTNDLFLHSLADLRMLKMNTETVHMDDFMKEWMKEWDSSDVQKEHINVKLISNVASTPVKTDPRRFAQVLDNLLINASKYGGSLVEIRTEEAEDGVAISVKDDGPGMAGEDIPFAFHKFYRGKNAKNQPGAGLGLYIVSYIVEQTGGTVSLHNTHPGLEVLISLPRAEQ